MGKTIGCTVLLLMVVLLQAGCAQVRVLKLNHQVRKFYQQGQYTEAIPLAEQALVICEKVWGTEHPHVALSLNNLAGLYKTMGAYAKAEPLYQRALTIWEKTLGPEHPDVALSLNNLAVLYKDMGAYINAEPLYQRALAIFEKVLGPEHPRVAASLNNLACLYRAMGAYARAEPLYQRALAIQEKTLGPEHPHVATSLDNLAVLYRAMGAYARAEPLYQRALAIFEKVLGPEHPDVATSLSNLALLYWTMGAYAKAEPLLQRTLTIREKVLGPEHPQVARSLNNLAGLSAALDRPDQAHPLFLRAQQIHAQFIEQIMGFTSEAQKLDFLATVKGNLHIFLSLISQRLNQNRSARKDALDVWLGRKGVVLEAQKRFQDALVYSDDPEAVKTMQALAQIRAQLTHLAFGGPGQEGPETYQQRLADLNAQKDRLEATLSRLSQVFAVSQKVAKADTTKIAAVLPPHTALLEFARVPLFNFTAIGTEKKWQPAHYLVFILHAGRGDDVRLVDLGDAATIDQAVTAFKKAIRRSTSDRTGAETTAAGRQVYQLVFAPLRQELDDIVDVFISPDGNLNLIPFEVLIAPDGRFLIEEYTFTYLAAGRDLLGFGASKEEEGQPPVLIGDPDFDLAFSPTPVSTPNPSQEGNKSTSPLEEVGLNRSSTMSGFHFKRLPGTRAEVETIQALLGEHDTALYTDNAAREAVLLRHPSPRILHLATHGFFLEDQELLDFATSGTFERGTRLTFTSASRQDTLRPLAQFENPLLRSGIVLAGANNAIGSAGQAEGIVTAEKILGLKLRGTELVVLSACDTGVGEVQSGEGVFGLRRAFTQAGAKSLVMSLWAVPDRETKELMIQFYQHLLAGTPRNQALRQAALRQMQMVKARYGFPYPYYWGAFVFLGEPR